MNRSLLQARADYIENILPGVTARADRKQLKQTLLDIKKKLAD